MIADVLDYMLDEGETDVFLLLLEDVKSPEKFKRAAEKALKAGKPLIVGKIGQIGTGPPRRHVAHRGARGLARSLPRHIYALRPDRRPRFRRDDRPGGRLPRLRRQAAGRHAHGHLHVVGRRRRVDGGRLRRRRARSAGARRRNARSDRRASAVLRHLAEPGRFHRARRAQSSATREFARLVGQSPLVDGVIVV